MSPIHYRNSEIWGLTPYDVSTERTMVKLGIYGKILEVVLHDESKLNDGLSPSRVNSILFENYNPNNLPLSTTLILAALGFKV